MIKKSKMEKEDSLTKEILQVITYQL